ncbi:MAG: hypothetical protein AAGF23_10795, partial [Acidobacteriota bacterium]
MIAKAMIPTDPGARRFPGRFRRAAAGLLLAAGISVLAGAAPASGDSPEFRINSVTAGPQQWPSVSAFDDGGFIVAWQSRVSPGDDTDDWSVVARPFDAAGDAIGDDFQVNVTTAQTQERPIVRTLSNGNFVVVWRSAYALPPPPSEPSDLKARVFTGAGTPASAEVSVNAPGTLVRRNLYDVVDGADGGFALVWRDSDGPVLFRTFDAAGTAATAPVAVSAGEVFGLPAVSTAGGAFVPMWLSEGGALSLRRYDADAQALGPVQTTPDFAFAIRAAADA